MLREPDADQLQSTLRRIAWVFPDRESFRSLPKWEEIFWDVYDEVATGLGLAWSWHPPDDIAIDATDRVPRVYLAGELEQCGFYLPIPPSISALVNDKLATNLTLTDSLVDPIPTIRIGTGRDLEMALYAPVLPQVKFVPRRAGSDWAATCRRWTVERQCRP